LWNYYTPALELMLRLHCAHPNERDELQHPVPTAAFAQHHLKKLLSEREMPAMLRIVEAGTRMESGQQRSLFKHEDGREATNENFVLCEVLLGLVILLRMSLWEKRRSERISRKMTIEHAKG
jgi:hypothetical protein